MSIMKKLLALMMTAALALSLVACGAKETEAPAEDPAAATDEQTEEPATDEKADGKVYKIGIIQLVEHEALDAATEGFKQAVIDGLGEDAVEFDFQNGQNDSNTCSTIANQFVSNDVDLIMANATPALQAAAAATADIPILATSITEYGVALSIDNFDGTVGGNISGTSDLAPLDQQAAMVTEWFPEAKTVGLLYCSGEPNSQYQVDVVKAALEEAGLTATLYPFSESNDLSSVCTTAAENSDVLYIPTDNTAANNTGIIDSICQPAKVPVIVGEEGICRGCGVATLSISYYDLGYTTGQMAVKILGEGADISTMPIEYTTTTKKYNAAICEALDITPVDGYEAMEE